jgi:hypothetical protein
MNESAETGYVFDEIPSQYSLDAIRNNMRKNRIK